MRVGLVIGSAILVAGCLGASGCSTYRTMEAMDSHTPKVFSGSRLNLHAIKGEEVRMRRFKAEAPAYPLADFPLSLVADMMIFPVTLAVASYEWVFDQP